MGKPVSLAESRLHSVFTKPSRCRVLILQLYLRYTIVYNISRYWIHMHDSHVFRNFFKASRRPCAHLFTALRAGPCAQ